MCKLDITQKSNVYINLLRVLTEYEVNTMSLAPFPFATRGISTRLSKIQGGENANKQIQYNHLILSSLKKVWFEMEAMICLVLQTDGMVRYD